MEQHNFSLSEVLEGKGTKIKGKEYFPTKRYVEPFLERLSGMTDNFRVQVQIPKQITLDDSGNIITEDLTFNRVAIEAILPHEYAFEGHVQVIGMVYGLDVRKPVVKFYSGAERSVCTNLCVFNPNMLVAQEIVEESAFDYKPVNHLLEQTEDIHVRLTKMQNTRFSCKDTNINEMLGMWIRNSLHMEFKSTYSKVKISNSDIMDAYKLLFENEASSYFVGNLEEATMFDCYESLTDVLSHETRDIMNKFEKIVLASRILGV